jgi:trans-2,3-dihydro-3-hydroxyanthranilate isomerase
LKSYRYLHLDVFTDRLFGGNQLAVFPDGRGLSDRTMQAIAREMNFSETTFVLPPERSDTDVRMRIFTPSAELPMAGHPTIGSTFALARTGLIRPGCERFVFGLGVGPIPVSLTWGRPSAERIAAERDDLTFAWMTQLNPTFSEPIDNAAGAAALLGLPASAVSTTGLPVQVVSCGLPCLLVPLATRRDVDEARLDSAAWGRFWGSSAMPTDCVFLFSSEPGADRATVYSRMFAPDFGIGEDPATGGASGPLGAYLVKHGVVTPGTAKEMLSLQGVKMGRPSYIHISIGVDRDEITSVRVGGESVLVGEGIFYVADGNS